MTKSQVRSKFRTGRRRSDWSVGLLTFSALGMLSACSDSPPAKPGDLKTAATACMASRDLLCAENNWRAFVDARPTDANAIASLCIVQDLRDEPEAAVIQCRKAIDLGEGTYDLFAAYATSLSKIGRTEEAIDWSYKTLTVVPSLVDVRSDLAKLLIQKRRRYEALTMLASFDDHLIALGQDAYFAGQRIAIESSLQPSAAENSSEQTALRLPKIDAQFFAPVSVGAAPLSAFTVDTGASMTSVNDAFLTKAKISYVIIHPHIDMETADGRHVGGKLISIPTLRVGAFTLTDVRAVMCPRCALLLGQESLAHFDIASSRVQGVEFLTLKPRRAT